MELTTDFELFPVLSGGFPRNPAKPGGRGRCNFLFKMIFEKYRRESGGICGK